MKIPRSREEEDEYEKMSLKAKDYDDYDDSESDRVEAEDINIDEYLSSDDTPDYKPKRTITVMTMKNVNLHWQHR
jgi:hypothetical protein